LSIIGKNAGNRLGKGGGLTKVQERELVIFWQSARKYRPSKN